MKELWERADETSFEEQVRAYAAEHKVSISEAYVMVGKPASMSKGEPTTTKAAALEEYGLTPAERNADIAALDAADRRHAREDAQKGSGRGNMTGAERSITMTTSEGMRAPEGFEARTTLAGGHELVCRKCNWTASLTPARSGFTVVISDRGGDIGFGTRERAGHAVEGVAAQHAESCGKS